MYATVRRITLIALRYTTILFVLGIGSCYLTHRHPLAWAKDFTFDVTLGGLVLMFAMGEAALARKIKT